MAKEQEQEEKKEELEQLEEHVETTDNNNPGSDEIVVAGTDNNFKALVEERDKKGIEAKEQLSEELEEEEEKESNSFPILKKVLLVVGVGCIGFGFYNAYKGQNIAQNPTNSES